MRLSELIAQLEDLREYVSGSDEPDPIVLIDGTPVADYYKDHENMHAIAAGDPDDPNVQAIISFVAGKGEPEWWEFSVERPELGDVGFHLVPTECVMS